MRTIILKHNLVSAQNCLCNTARDPSIYTWTWTNLYRGKNNNSCTIFPQSWTPTWCLWHTLDTARCNMYATWYVCSVNDSYSSLESCWKYFLLLLYCKKPLLAPQPGEFIGSGVASSCFTFNNEAMKGSTRRSCPALCCAVLSPEVKVHYNSFKKI